MNTATRLTPLHRLKQNPQVFAWVLLIVLALIWGTSFILIKRGLVVFSPVQVASVRVLAAGVFLMGFSIQAFRTIPRKKWLFAFLSGNLGVFIPAFLFAFAQTKLSSSVSGILNALTPLFTLLIGILFFAQRTTWGKGLGFFLGLLGSIGITLISSPSGKLEFNSYTLLVLTASLFYGINGNMTKHYLAGIKPLALTSLSLTLVAPFALGVLLLSDIQTNYQQHDNSFWALLSLIALGMSSTAIAMILFNYLIQMTSAVFASSVTYLIPLVAIGWGLWDGEMLTWLHLACMATIVGGVYLANRQAK